MAAANGLIHIFTLTDIIPIRLQRLGICFEGPASQWSWKKSRTDLVLVLEFWSWSWSCSSKISKSWFWSWLLIGSWTCFCHKSIANITTLGITKLVSRHRKIQDSRRQTGFNNLSACRNDSIICYSIIDCLGAAITRGRYPHPKICHCQRR